MFKCCYKRRVVDVTSFQDSLVSLDSTFIFPREFPILDTEYVSKKESQTEVSPKSVYPEFDTS